MVNTYVAIIINIYIRQNYDRKSNKIFVFFVIVIIFMLVKKGDNFVKDNVDQVWQRERKRERFKWQDK